MTYKAKNIILLIGFLLITYISYKLTISKTLALKKEYKELKQQEILFKNVPKQLSVLKQKEKYYDSLLTKYQINGSSIQNSLLKTINLIAEKNNLKVVSFLEPHLFETENLIHKTYLFTLEGEYNSILQLTYKLEQDTKFGEIINLHFEKKKNFRKNKHYLQAEFLFRSLK